MADLRNHAPGARPGLCRIGAIPAGNLAVSGFWTCSGSLRPPKAPCGVLRGVWDLRVATFAGIAAALPLCRSYLRRADIDRCGAFTERTGEPRAAATTCVRRTLSECGGVALDHFSGRHDFGPVARRADLRFFSWALGSVRRVARFLHTGDLVHDPDQSKREGACA